MHTIGLDLGGTKLAGAIFDGTGEMSHETHILLNQRGGHEVGAVISNQVRALLSAAADNAVEITGIGISVPGIYYAQSGTVWAPNIPDWDEYPLLAGLQALPELRRLNLKIDSDRACYILGETWQGAAQGCRNAIFLAVGTGIGAGILIDGKILRGANDIAGAIGWLGLQRPFAEKYRNCGCFEYQASGDGIARMAREFLAESGAVPAFWQNKSREQITARDIFQAYDWGDPVAKRVIQNSIELWGMAVANLVSLFNPEKIILGGGVFGPAARFLPEIFKEALRWGQPISMRHVRLEVTALGPEAGLIGAGRLPMEF